MSQPYGLASQHYKENVFMLITILIVILVMAHIVGLPSWPHSRSWGYGPSGGID